MTITTPPGFPTGWGATPLPGGYRGMTSGLTYPSPYPLVDVVKASEPASGTPSTPGILDEGILGTGITGRDVLSVLGRYFGPSEPASGGDCPGITSVRDPITGNCIDLAALPPGGRPAVTGPVATGAASNGYGPAVQGRFGIGLTPRVEVMTVRRCPKGMALGKDGVCYDGLGRNSPKREWPQGMKPLLTPGERRAIRVAGSAAKKLDRSKKSLRKASKALAKVC